jgi:hypothetical protein
MANGYLLEFNQVDRNGRIFTYRQELFSSRNGAISYIHNVIDVNRGINLIVEKDFEDNDVYTYSYRSKDSGKTVQLIIVLKQLEIQKY